ncbi:MAG: hypothetical protein LBC64_01775 [Fibromonadaceae bacterium]|jgi:hypothetical protein|nr:hypothetical protein [Fibromonadaceae bacterium]
MTKAQKNKVPNVVHGVLKHVLGITDFDPDREEYVVNFMNFPFYINKGEYDQLLGFVQSVSAGGNVK